MKMLFTLLFAAIALTHLISLCFDHPRLQNVTKVCLLPLLLVAYLLSAESLRLIIILAMAFGWGGDILLIKINNKTFFQLGLGCFLLGHICYILSLLMFTPTVHFTVLVISCIAAIPAGVIFLKIVHPDKAMMIPVIAYSVILGSMVLCALQFLLNQGGIIGAAVFAGSLCFMVSDSLLAYFTFQKIPKYGNILVMFPYILAQAGLVLGLAYM
ncbi:hypothetical protein AGMMS49587_07590 [Spirochaetia bacterium]|nr:hypothetical protein AGMMS49587_07590 [Spirochaetia bacterium]